MSSKRRLRRKACAGKARHASAEAAMRQVRAARAAGYTGGWLDVYRCRWCNCYHVGHARQRRLLPVPHR